MIANVSHVGGLSEYNISLTKLNNANRKSKIPIRTVPTFNPKQQQRSNLQKNIPLTICCSFSLQLRKPQKGLYAKSIKLHGHYSVCVCGNCEEYMSIDVVSLKTWLTFYVLFQVGTFTLQRTSTTMVNIYKNISERTMTCLCFIQIRQFNQFLVLSAN